MIATLYATADGPVVFHAGLPYSLPIAPPPEAVQSVSFDPNTNPQLVQDFTVNAPLYRIDAGVLTKSGVAVPLTADGPAARDDKQLAQIKAALDADTNLTQAQLRAILRYVLRHLPS